MKTKATIRAGAIILVITLLSIPGFGQVIIEGTRFGVDLSNRDGRIEVSSPSGYGETIIVRSPVTPGKGIRTNNNATNANPGNTDSVPFRPRTALPHMGAVQPSSAYRSVHVIDVNRIQKRAKLERELEVIKTTRTAWMAFEADQLFGRRQVSLGKSSKSLLDKVINYMALSGGKGITVSYDFLSGSDSAEQGMARANSVVDYLQAKTGLSPGWFTITNPEPVRKSVVQNGGYRGDVRRQYKSVVNVRIQR